MYHDATSFKPSNRNIFVALGVLTSHLPRETSALIHCFDHIAAAAKCQTLGLLLGLDYRPNSSPNQAMEPAITCLKNIYLPEEFFIR